MSDVIVRITSPVNKVTFGGAQGSSGVTWSLTAPATPRLGQGWGDSATGIVAYWDGSVWVASTAPQTSTDIAAFLGAADDAAARERLGAAKKFVIAQGPLSIPNYSLQNTTIHGSLDYSDSPVFGYRYWAAHTPYPALPSPGVAISPLEYPSVCASNDGLNWEVPTGMQTPVIVDDTNHPDTTTYQIFADASICITASGTLRMYWIASNQIAGQHRNALLGAECTDGVNWILLGNEGWMIKADLYNLASPSVVALAADSYVLWYTKVESTTRTIGMRTSTDGVTWSAETELSVANGKLPAGASIWHCEVRKTSTGYMMLAQQPYSPARASAGLCVLTSVDGETWTGDPTSFIHGDYTDEPKAIAGGGYYRSGFIPREDGLIDILLCTLVSEQSGDGDTTGDVVGASGLYTRSVLSWVRGADPDAENHWQWVTPPEKPARSIEVPLITTRSQRTEIFDPFATNVGWLFRYATPYAGLAAGASERVTFGVKKQLLMASSMQVNRFSGRMAISGARLIAAAFTPEESIFCSGNEAAGNKTLATTTAGVHYWTGNKGFFVRIGPTAANTGWSHTLTEGDIITFHNASTGVLEVTGTYHRGSVAATYLNVYIREPSGILPLIVGQKVKVNGVDLTYDAVAQAVWQIPYPCAPGGINVFAHPYVTGNDDGGFVEVWNNTSTIWYGQMEYKSYR